MTSEAHLQGYQSRQVYHGPIVQFLILDHRLAATRTLSVPYVVISITESHDSFPDAVIAPSAMQRGILRLRFDDIDDPEDALDGCQPFVEHHARQIVRFVLSHRHEIGGIVVHCHAGVSRSAAVAAALSEWLNGEEADFFENYFLPNPRVHDILSRTIAIMEPDSGERIGEGKPLR